jgi:hypothetical protein
MLQEIRDLAIRMSEDKFLDDFNVVLCTVSGMCLLQYVIPKRITNPNLFIQLDDSIKLFKV